MNCQQFQEILPHIIESGGNPDQEAHLQTCQPCSDLVRDLRYIAEQAKLLLPMHDPNPKVWKNIEQSLQREGLLPEGRMSPQGHKTTTHPAQKKSWTPLGILMALAALAVLGVVLVKYRPVNSQSTEASNTQPSASGPTETNGDDQTLLSQVSQQQPELRKTYEENLNQVNAYIADAKKAASENPDDESTQDYLQGAYQEKAVLYEMATYRSLE
jgi:hypothetical protein